MLRRVLPDSRRWQLLFAATSLVLAWMMVQSAWLSDDGLITFRTLEHFVNGDGLRFNLAERVQSYTRPLWLFLLAPVYLATGEAFYTPILVSLVVSSVAVAGLLVVPVREGRWLAASAAGACLLSSKAFVDYTTSGLETPLSYLLLAIGIHLALSEPRRLGALALVTSLAFVNRMDSVLLLLPPLLLSIAGEVRGPTPTRSWLASLLLGFTPALSWLVFATFYYGTPLPNTFYAKLTTGIEGALLREQGLFFLGHSFRFDIVTPAVILISLCLAAVVATRRRSFSAAAVAAGIVLQLLYLVEIGGDFMAGRLLAAILRGRRPVGPCRLAGGGVRWARTPVSGGVADEPAFAASRGPGLREPRRGPGPGGSGDLGRAGLLLPAARFARPGGGARADGRVSMSRRQRPGGDSQRLRRAGVREFQRLSRDLPGRSLRAFGPAARTHADDRSYEVARRALLPPGSPWLSR